MIQQQLWQDEPGVAPPPVQEEHVALARALPETVRLGTSSWSFPGWKGLVYDRRTTSTVLAREGLRAYGRHPLLRCVGLDRTYYAPLPAAEFGQYSRQVPAEFRFVVKAPELCTVARFPEHPRYGAQRGQANPRFLDPGWVTDAFLGPLLEGLGSRDDAIVFQFPPQSPSVAGGPLRFARRLGAFLSRLPEGPIYATEIRTREWLTRDYARATVDAGACHCVTVHPRMPGVTDQAHRASVEDGPALVVRWMLGGGQQYDAARARYEPFDRLVDPDESTRREIARSVARLVRSGKPVYVTVNNKAEGSAPRSVFELSRMIVGELEGNT